MPTTRLDDQTKGFMSTLSGDLQRTFQQEIEGLRNAIEERFAMSRGAAVIGEQIDEGARNVDTLAAELTTGVAAEAHHHLEATAVAELDFVRRQLHTEAETIRSELNAKCTALENRLIQVERSMSTMRRMCDEHAANLAQAGERIDLLEQRVA